MLLFWYAQKSAFYFKLPVPWLMAVKRRHLSFYSCPSSKNKCVILEV